MRFIKYFSSSFPFKNINRNSFFLFFFLSYFLEGGSFEIDKIFSFSFLWKKKKIHSSYYFLVGWGSFEIGKIFFFFFFRPEGAKKKYYVLIIHPRGRGLLRWMKIFCFILFLQRRKKYFILLIVIILKYSFYFYILREEKEKIFSFLLP